MNIKFSDLQLFVKNYCLSYDIPEEVGERFMGLIVSAGREAINYDAAVRAAMETTVEIVLKVPESNLKSRIENHKMYLLFDIVADIFFDKDSLNVVFCDESLGLLS